LPSPLHSFPTRRSSDLAVGRSLLRAVRRHARSDLVFDDAPAATKFAKTVEVADQRHVRVGWIVRAAAFLPCLLRRTKQREVGLQDRKSTRLNSSHGSIS